MSTGKRNLEPFVIASAADLSANFTSTPTIISTLDRANLVINVTGTPTGTLTVQASIDYKLPNVPGTWYDIPLGIISPTGAAYDYMIDFTETGMRAIRVNWVFSAGVGNMTATIFGKES